MESDAEIRTYLNRIKTLHPVIHCITNTVTMNDCANLALALGASPTMAHHEKEVEEIAAGACLQSGRDRMSGCHVLSRRKGTRSGTSDRVGSGWCGRFFLSQKKMHGSDPPYRADLYPGKLF